MPTITLEVSEDTLQKFNECDAFLNKKLKINLNLIVNLLFGVINQIHFTRK